MFLTRNNSAYFKLEPRKQKEVRVKEGEESVKKEDKENKEDEASGRLTGRKEEKQEKKQGRR